MFHHTATNNIIARDKHRPRHRKSVLRAVFIDFSKAFDRVNHGTLLEKLKSLGLSQTLLDWTYSFLEGRTQCVKIGNSKSEWKKVPQGTRFGMEGFIVHINDLQLLTETLKYVDDAA